MKKKAIQWKEKTAEQLYRTNPELFRGPDLPGFPQYGFASDGKPLEQTSRTSPGQQQIWGDFFPDSRRPYPLTENQEAE